MVNNTRINSNSINYAPPTGTLVLDNISFDNYNLQNRNIVIEGEGFGLRDYPNREINTVSSPQSDGLILNDIFFRGRNISVDGHLRADTKEELDNLIDEFKLNLSKKDKYLKWRVDGKMRKIKATTQTISFGEKMNIAISFSLTFVSQNSYWENEQNQSFLIENNSQNNLTENLNNIGGITYGLFILGFKTGLVGVNTIEIKIDGLGITINETISDNDILVIDGENSEVLLNGTSIDYEGIFPVLQTGDNSTQININGTFTNDMNIVYPNKLL